MTKRRKEGFVFLAIAGFCGPFIVLSAAVGNQSWWWVIAPICTLLSGLERVFEREPSNG